MHIHILGICGTFMGSLALLARQAGHRVTGCDAGVYPPMSTQLQEAGIDLIEGWDASQLKLGADLYVIGNVVTRGNPLMEAILDAGVRFTSGPQWLSEHILVGRSVLAVAGTHGKTTTSTVLAWLLRRCGVPAGYLIGGVPLDLPASAELGDASAPFVIEADEYDTAFFDKRSKFVHYRPKVAILNNLEFDHADIFADLAAIQTQFHHLVRTIPRSGTVLTPKNDPAIEAVLARGCWSTHRTFGPHAQIEVQTLTHGQWQLWSEGTRIEPAFSFALEGPHQQSNVAAAVSAAVAIGLSPEQCAQVLSEFRGVKRRLELRGAVRGIEVFDDFAHHPTAIRLTLQGLRQRREQQGQTGRILAVLEPRSNTMKRGVFQSELAASLDGADRVYAFGPQSGQQALGWNLSAALAPLGARAQVHEDLASLVAAIAQDAQPGDALLVMSNGGFGGVHQKLLTALEN